jgi:hypothetical protein
MLFSVGAPLELCREEHDAALAFRICTGLFLVSKNPACSF